MEFRELYKPLLRWWWLIVAAALVAAAFSFVAGFRQPDVFRSSTTVMIGRAIQDPNPSDYQLYTSQQLAATYADIAARRPIREATMKALGLTWLPAYVARPLPNTQLLEISVTDAIPERAQAVANELANQLILQSPTGRSEDLGRQEFINQQLDDLQVKIQQTQVEVDARQAELANLTSARQIADTQNQIYALQSKLDTLRSNYTDLLANTQGGALNTLTIIESAVLPEYPVGPNVPLMVITAVVFASALAVGAVYLLAYLDNTIKSPEEIKRLVDLPMLIGIPVIFGETYPEKLVTAKQPRSPIAEAFRSLRTAVQFSTIDRPESSALLVSSPNPSEGKSLTVANLATVIAQAGNRVLIIDSDLRLPAQHKIFELDNHIGLTEFLRNVKVNELDESVNAMLDKVIQATPVEGLWVLTSGPIPPNPSELLGSNTYRLLLSALKGRFDYVVLDSPPVLIVTDSVILSTLVDGVILVLDADSTQKNQLRQAVERLREVNANILGVVVNRLTPKMDGYTNYYYYYRRKNYYDGSYGYHSYSSGTNGKEKKSSQKRRAARSPDVKSNQEG
jgi:polysaccharide biosynthesis transport protein